MLWSFVKRKRFQTGLLVAFAIGLVFCLVSGFDLFHGIRMQLGDNLFKAAGLQEAPEPQDTIVIVAIDEKSLDQLGRFSSWPRSCHTRLVETLADAGARVIVFDLLFSEPTPDDAELAAAMHNAGNVILPYVYTNVAYSPSVIDHAITMENKVLPLDILAQEALGLGHAVMLPDEDGIIRQVPLVIREGSVHEPSLALTAISKYLRRPQVIETPFTSDTLSFAGRDIPLDSLGNMLINYTDESSALVNFTRVSYSDVFAGTVAPEVFTDKIAVIGVTATGLSDVFWTPMGRVSNGVEVHAAAMQTVLAANFLRPVPVWLDLVLTMMLVLLCSLAVLRFRMLWAAVTVVCLILIYLLTSFRLFDAGVMMNLLHPTVAMAGAFVGINVFNVVLERSEKQEITRTFGRYVSPEIAGRILKAQHQDSLDLSGTNREITAFYIDARHFTSLMENFSSNTVFRALNDYMGVIIDAVQKHHGIVNKFAGDAILATWNTPVESDDHALRATLAALDAQRAIRKLNEDGISPLNMEFGIGIMTGDAIVGNMGSADRLEFSVLGDAVNISAWLSGTAPGNRIWIGDETYRRVGDYFTTTEIGDVSVKGRHEPVRVYEIVDHEEEKINIP